MTYAPRTGIYGLASREVLLRMSRSPLAYGRRLLSAQAIKELSLRAMARHARVGCGLARIMRLEKLIAARQRQVVGFMTDAPSYEKSDTYASVLESLQRMHAHCQALLAMESIEKALKDLGICP